MTLQLPPVSPSRPGLLRRVLRARVRPPAPVGAMVETVDRDGRIRVQRVRR